MEWVETTAKTVDEAKGLALDRLGVAEEDAEFEILDEPRPGLFGRMRGEARVRARVRPTRPRPKVERRDRRRKGSGDAKSDAAGAPASAEPDTDAGSDTDSDTDSVDQPVLVVAAAGADQADVSSAASEDKPARSRRRSGRSSGSTRGEKDMDQDEAPQDAEGQPDPAEVGAAAVEFLRGLVDAFGAEATVELDESGEEMEVRVEGENLGLLVGPRGATLLAIQDLTRVASQRRLGDHQTRLRIDIAGYRQKRREALGRFAEKVAAEVAASGEERVLEPMPSADRKVVHDTLSGRDDVVTRSEGEDPRRYVVIAPA